MQPALVEPVRQPVELASVKARVTENDFDVVPGGRVTLARGPDIPPDALEKSSHEQAFAPY